MEKTKKDELFELIEQLKAKIADDTLKFKVGDRVRLTSNVYNAPVGSLGTVESIDSCIYVKWDGTYSFMVRYKHIELIPEEPKKPEVKNLLFYPKKDEAWCYVDVGDVFISVDTSGRHANKIEIGIRPEGAKAYEEAVNGLAQFCASGVAPNYPAKVLWYLNHCGDIASLHTEFEFNHTYMQLVANTSGIYLTKEDCKAHVEKFGLENIMKWRRDKVNGVVV